MKNIGGLIRELRKEKGYPLRKVAAYLDIDQAILSKIERGQRKPSKEQVIRLAEFFNYNEKEMLLTYLSDLVVYQIGDEKYAKDALILAEQKIEYLNKIRMNRSTILKVIKEYLEKNKNILRAWLFGSFAREVNDTDSDLDIMIEVNRKERFSLFDLSKIKYELEKMIPYDVDVVMKDALKPQVMENIKADLTLIYERSSVIK